MSVVEVSCLKSDDPEIWVLKESGEKEIFDSNKVLTAVRRAGLSAKEADEALRLLRSRLKNNITTKQIYGILYDIIDGMRPEVSHRYNLKRALFAMGPEGHWFEDYISRLLELQGYDTKIRQIIEGKCVGHEIDVVAAKGGKTSRSSSRKTKRSPLNWSPISGQRWA